MKSIAIACQKGGTSKTTSTLCIGAGLHRAGFRTLYIDTDAQGSLSLCLNAAQGLNVYDILIDGKPVTRALQTTAQGDLIAADGRLSARGLLTRKGDESRLKMALEPLRDRYDVCLIDAPPQLGPLSMNALHAADALIIPMRPDRLSLNALHELHSTIQVTRPTLEIYGIIVSMYDGRTTAHRLMLDEITEQARALGIMVYNPPIRRSIALEEIQITGRSIFDNPRSNAAQDYQAIVEQIILQLNGE